MIFSVFFFLNNISESQTLRYGRGDIQLSTAVHAGTAEELSVNAQESTAIGLAFNNDGSKLFIIGSSDDAVVEYHLSVNFDVSTAVYAGADEEFFVGAQESNPTHLAFNNDGSKLFIIGNQDDAVVEYHLSVNFDVSTATYAGAAEEFSVNAQESTPRALAFNNEGSKLFIVGNQGDAVVEYHLSVNFDVSTATYAGAGEEFSVRAQESIPQGLAFNHDGSQMFVIGATGLAVVEYDLSVNFDISTATYAGAAAEFSVNAQETSPTGLAFNLDESRMFVIGSAFDDVIEYVLPYALPDAQYTEAISNDGSINNSSPLLISLSGDTFNDTGNDDLLNVGSQVTLGNVPAGLTPVLSLSDNDTLATLTFTGNATNHQSADDVADITFSFDDSAFSSATAASVTNSGEVSPFSSNVPISFLENASLQYSTVIDVSGASYAGAGEEFSVNAQDGQIQDLTFNNDGSKMFVVGLVFLAVSEYTLTTNFDVSTAIYAGDGEQLSVFDRVSSPRDLAFNNDGTKLFVLGSIDDVIIEYDLTVSFDVSTGIYAGAAEEFFVGAQETIATGLAFSNDGMKLFVIGLTDDAIIEYDLTVPYDVSTAIYAGAGEEFFVGAEEDEPQGLAFNNDGSRMFVVGHDDEAVVEYHLSVNFDVSTATYAGAVEEFFVGAQESTPRGLAFSNDGTRLFVIGNDDDAVVEYALPGAEYTEVPANDGSITSLNPLLISLSDDTFNDADNDDLLNVGSQVTLGNIPAGLSPVLSLSDNDTRLTVTFTGNTTDHQPADDVADITFAFDDSAFSSATAESVINSGKASPFSSNVPISFLANPSLQYGTGLFDVSGASYAGSAEEFLVSAQEGFPSDLAFNTDGSKMFVVGTGDDAVVEYTLTIPFDVSTATHAGAAEEFSVGAEESTPTGLAFNTDGSKMFVIGSSGDAVVEYHLSVNFDVSTATYAGASEEFSVNAQVSTPQGLTFNHDGSELFVIDSGGDVVVEYHLSVNFDVSTATYAGASEEFSVNAQVSTPQGLTFNHDGSELFVIGSGGDAVVPYHLSVNFDVSTAVYAGAAEEFFVGAQERISTGLAFNSDGSKLFVVGTSDDAVVEYILPGAEYTEVPANDGSITSLNPLLISLSGDTFNDADNDDLLNIGSQVTLGNVPAGLTPVLSLSDNDTRLTVTFTGNATDHQPADDVTDITFAFDDSAFSSSTAVSVANSGETNPFSSNVPISFLENALLQYNAVIDVSGANYAGAGEEFSVSAHELFANDLAFNTDGSKMFVVGTDDDAVVEYTLTTPFDVSTAIYAGAAEEFSVNAQETSPLGLAFNNDGSKLFIIGITDVAVVEYNLSTNFDVSTATYAGAGEEFFVGAQESTPEGFAFNTDGSKMFVIGSDNDAVVEYHLSTNFDISTAIYAGAGEEFSVAAQETIPRGLAFSSDGSKMFVIGSNGDAVVEYHLSVNFDVSTATYAGANEEFVVVTQENVPTALAFSSDGSKLFVIGIGNSTVVEYALPGAQYTEALANDGSINNTNSLIISLTGDTFEDVDNDDLLNVGSQVSLGNIPAGLSPVLSLSHNDTRVTVTFTGNATDHQPADDVADITFAFDDSAFSSATAASVVNSGQASSFSSNVPISFLTNASLQYGAVIDVSGATYAGVAEEFSVGTQDGAPQGLAFNSDGSKMYVIGSSVDVISEYSLTSPYDVSTASYAGASEGLSVNAQDVNPRGLTFNQDGSKLFIIGNGDESVIEYNLSTNFDVSSAIYAGAVEEFFVGNEESIPTGLAFSHDGSKMFVIGSSDNAVIEYHLSVNFDASTATYAGAGEEFFVGAEESSPQDLAFNHDGSQMFVVGSGDDAVIAYHLSVNFDVSTAVYAGAAEEFFVGAQESTPLGLAFNSDRSKMFVVGNNDDAVVEYALPGAQYTEALANDGSINNTNSLIISLTGDTFNDADNDDLLNVGSQVTLGNVPAGLTPVLSLSDNDTRVTVTFTGNAADHQPADDVADITFSFDDSAFSSATAASVTNSGETSPFSSNVPISFLENALLQYSAVIDVSGVNYAGAGEEFSVSAHELFANDLAFNTDGSKMFVVGTDDDAVVEYTLNTPFDVSTATYAGAAEEFSVGAEENRPRGLAFNNDGSKLFITGNSDGAVIEYHLSVNFDVSSAIYAGAVEEFFVGNEESIPTGLAFNSDGLKLFIIGSGDAAVVEYNLSTNFDVSTATHAGDAEEFSVSDQESFPEALAFNHDGSQMFVIGINSNAVIGYNLSTNFDVSTANYAGAGTEFSVSDQESLPRGLAFSNDASGMFVIGTSEATVVEYTLPGAQYTEALANDGSISNTNSLIISLTGDTFNDADNDDLLNVGSQVTLGNVPAGLSPVLSLSDNDTRVTVTFTGNAADHQPADDVADITFSFDDSAFSSATAASVTNSGETSPFSSNVPISFLENASLEYGTGLFDVSGAIYAGAAEGFFVGGQDNDPQGMAFNNDGSKMFVLGNGGDVVVEYDLSVNFDISTATYAGAGEEFFVGNEDDLPTGVAFNNDGSKMFVVGVSDDAVVEYNLSTSFDVSTATYAGAAEEFFVGAEENSPTGLAFSSDGSKMFVVGSSGDAVVEYSLSTNFDVSTATYAGADEEFSVAAQEDFPLGLAFNNDGSKLFVIGTINNAVVEYSLSTNFDVSTATYAGADEEFLVRDEDDLPTGVAFNSDGSRMFVVGSIGDAVVEYTIPGAQYTEALANDGSISNTNSLIISLTGDTFNDADNDDLLNVGSQVSLGNIPAGLTPVLSLSDNDTRVTVTFTGNAADHQPADDVADITFSFDDSAFSSATAASVTNSGEISPFSSNVPISFLENASLEYGTGLFDVSGAIYAGASEEFFVGGQDIDPQGLAFNNDGSKMFVIGNGGDVVVEYDLSVNFDISTATHAGAGEEFFVGNEDDLPTGVAFNNDGSKMFVVGVSDDAVVEYDLSVNFDVSTATYAGAAEEFFVGAEEGSPRGLAFSSDGSKMFVVGSSGDAVVEYSLSTNFDISTATYAGADEEFSVAAQEDFPLGLAFNNDGSRMFVVGTNDDAVVEYHLPVNFDVSTATYAGAGEEFFVRDEDDLPTGVAFNSDGSRMFVVGSIGDAVVEYTIPGAQYTEALANDGSINNTNSLIISLSGDTFNDADNDDLLNVGSQVTLGNVPAGLTPVLSLSDNDTRVTVTFTGNAADHQPADDVADITFSFDDSAFSSATAASVTNSGEISPFSSNVPISFLENASLQYGTGIDVSGATYAGAAEELSISAQEATPTGMAFNNDGSKMFVVGINDDAVVEYTLTTPFDVSTATYAGAAEEFSVGAEESAPRGLAFNNDGSKLFIIGNGDTGLAVVEYHLSTGFDVSTANYAGAAEEFFVGNEENIPTGLAFNNDGSKMFVVGNGDVAVVEYNLSTNFDVSTAAHAGDAEEFSVSDQESFPEALAFNHDGSQMFVTGLISDAVIAYHLSVNFDVSTATYAGASEEFFVGDEETSPRGLAFSSDGSGMFVIGSIGDAVVEYTLPDAQYTEALANDGSVNNTNSLIISLTGDTFNDADNDDLLNVGSQVTLGNVPAGLSPVLSLSDNDTRVTVTFTGNAADHQPVDDVADITFSFDDSAFSSATAASVTNSGETSPFSSHVPISFLENASLQYGTGIDVSGATYAGAAEEFFVGAEEGAPRGLAFSSDGSKMFVVGSGGDAVVEYSLSTNFDVSTAIYAGTAEEFSVEAQESSPRGLAFSSDGSKMFVVGSSDDAVVEYSLSTDFDVSTATYAGVAEEFFVGAQESSPRGLAFNNDGSKMFVIGASDNAVIEYDLSVNFDISTATYAGASEEFSVNAQESTPQGLAFSSDGSKMFVVGSNGDAVVEYSLSTNFDISTATYAGAAEEFFVGAQESTPRGLAFSNDGTRLFVIGNDDDAVVEYTLPGAEYTEALANDGSINNTNSLIISLTGDAFNDADNDDLLNVGSQVSLGNIPAGLTPVLSLSDNDTRVTVTFTGNATDHQPVDDVADITFSFDDSAFSSATAASVTNSGQASPFSSNVPINFLENASLQYGTGIDVSGATYAGAAEELSISAQESFPEALAFNNDGSKMFVVGNDDVAVVEYNLSTNFDVSTAIYAGAAEEFSVNAQEAIPRGLAFNNDGSQMFVVGSSDDAVVEYSLSTDFDVSTATYAGAAEEFFVGDEESTPRGLSFSSDGSKMFVIGSDNDAVVEYHLSVSFDVSTATYAGAAEEFSVNAQESTPQGLAFNTDGSQMFVVGTNGDAVVEYHLSVNFDVSTATYAGAGEEFFVGDEETASRGLAFSNDGSRMFVIGNIGEAVVEYAIPGAQYTEALANDGSINNTNSLIISITGDTFNDTGNDDLLNVGSQVSLGNIPSGLSPVLSLSDNDTRVTVTFTGNATDHQPADDVADVTFSFDDSAFSSATAASVTNSGETSPFSSNVPISFLANPSLQYGTGIDVSGATYAGASEEFFVGIQDTAPQGLAFNNDGSKMFVLGFNDSAVIEYHLSVNFDVSTATYAGAGEEFFVGNEVDFPLELVFNNDGSKMFVIGSSDVITEYNLSVNFDVSTATYAGAAEGFFVGAEDFVTTGMAFNNEGSRMFVIGVSDRAVVEYHLSVNFDVSTATYAGAAEEFSVSDQEISPQDIAFSDDGSKMFVIGSGGDAVVEYHLSVNFDVSTATYAGAAEEFFVGAQESVPTGLAFNSDGSKLFVVGTSDNAVVEYTLPGAQYTEVLANDGSVNNANSLIIRLTGDTFNDPDNDDLLNMGSQVTLGNVPAGLTPVLSLSDNDTRVTVTFTGNATDHQPADDVADITFAFDDSAFSNATAASVANSGEASPFNSNVPISFLENASLQYGTAIDVSGAIYAGAAEEFFVGGPDIDPQGLAFNNEGSKMFVLGNGGDVVVEYDLSVNFDISTATHAGAGEEFFVGNEDDLPTGVAFNNDGSKMFVVGVSDDAVVEYHLSVNFDVSTAIYAGAAEEFSVNAQEGIPTGVAFNNDGSKMFVVGLANDAVVEYDLSVNFDISTATYAGAGEEFFVGDEEGFSTGLAFNNDGSKLFIIGNSDGAVIEYHLSVNFDVSTAAHAGDAEEFSVSDQEIAPQDIAFSDDGSKMFVVGNIGGAVVEYTIPGAQYTEVLANDGSVNNANSLIISLTGDTFNDSDNDDLLNVGSQVTLGNVPAGLSPVLSLSDNDTRVTVTFTGNATDHQPADDVADITFAFDDSAFSSATAASVTNSGEASPFSSNASIHFDNNPVLRYGQSAIQLSTTTYAGAAEEFSVNAQEIGATGLTFNHSGLKLFVLGSGDDAIVEYNLMTPYDVSTATYAGATEEFSVNTQEILPQGLIFDQDGSKLFVIGIDGDAVVEYHLSTNFDVSTATYAGAAEEFFVGAQEGIPTGLAFNHDGSRMYVVGQENNEVFQYNLSINFDVSTAAYSNESLDIQLQESSPTGLVFNEDGTEMYLIGSAGDDVVQYQLTSPFDVTTASHTGTSQEFSVATEEGVPQDLFFDPVGRTLLILGNTGGGAIAEYHLMPNPVYSETSDNDGEVASSSPLVIQLSGDTFDDTGDDDLLDLPAQLTINNIPAGLIPVLSLSDNDTRVTVTFTGNATNHQSGDDVADITFSFDDTAFVNNPAASVQNSGSSSAQSSNSAIDFFNGAPAGIETDLALWLRSDFGTGSTTDGASLSTWVGQSAAAVQASQGVPANQPVFHDNAIDNLNFNPVISFDGTNGFLELPDNIVAAGDDALGFYAVWNSNADNVTQRILSLGSTTSGSGLALQLGSSGNAGLQLEVAPNNQGLLVPYSINTTALLTANTQALSGNDVMVALAGAAFSTGTVGNTNRSLTSSDNYLGQAPTATERFNGQIAEIIVYNEPQSASERQRVESYLALKYGITLSNDNDGDGTPFEAAGISEGDYVASDELTVFWDAGANASYHNNIAGIVRDDGSDLEQKQSRSSNADALVTMGLDDDTNGPEQTNSANSGSFQADLSALVWGHDGEALYDNDENIDFDPVQVASRLNREWRVQETGTVGTVVVQFDVSNLEGPQGPGTSDESQIVLLVDNDSDFSTGASLVLQASVTNNDGLVNFRVDFNDGQYFTLASSEENALPITLISFDVEAHNDHVLLKWSTASEVNNSLFRIERSEDGSHFRSIGFKEGAGNSQSLEEYSFLDRQPQPGNNYYRLVDIDNQGNEHVSEIRRLYFETEEALLSLYPNPIQQNNLLKFKSSDLSLHDIRIIVDSAHGQRILDRVEAGKSYQELSIDTHTWTPGIYMLRVYEDGHLYKGPVKIVKQH